VIEETKTGTKKRITKFKKQSLPDIAAIKYLLITKFGIDYNEKKAEIELMAKRLEKGEEIGSMNILMKKVLELKEYENNPRNNEAAIDAVAKSIEEFVFKVPIAITKDDVIIAGHTRLKASLKLGLACYLHCC
jgi:hypothetical protein